MSLSDGDTPLYRTTTAVNQFGCSVSAGSMNVRAPFLSLDILLADMALQTTSASMAEPNKRRHEGSDDDNADQVKRLREDPVDDSESDLEVEAGSQADEDSHASNTLPVEKHEIAPNGNVTLVFEDDRLYDEEWCLTQIRMTVSAAHLSLKSRVFRAMLENRGLSEGEALHSQGHVEISLPDDSFNSFLIIMNIIHGHRKEVPRKLELSELEGVACLCDKYEWGEVMMADAERWMRFLRHPKSVTGELYSFIWISVVFELQRELRNFMRIAIFEGVGPFEKPELEEGSEVGTIPSVVIGKIWLMH